MSCELRLRLGPKGQYLTWWILKVISSEQMLRLGPKGQYLSWWLLQAKACFVQRDFSFQGNDSVLFYILHYKVCIFIHYDFQWIDNHKQITKRNAYTHILFHIWELSWVVVVLQVMLIIYDTDLVKSSRCWFLQLCFNHKEILSFYKWLLHVSFWGSFLRLYLFLNLLISLECNFKFNLFRALRKGSWIKFI